MSYLSAIQGLWWDNFSGFFEMRQDWNLTSQDEPSMCNKFVTNNKT